MRDLVIWHGLNGELSHNGPVPLHHATDLLVDRGYLRRPGTGAGNNIHGVRGGDDVVNGRATI